MAAWAIRPSGDRYTPISSAAKARCRKSINCPASRGCKNGVSVFFMLAHRNQRSLTLDLKHPEGRAVARRLVERADVLVQNFRPGVMARHGLDWETAKAIHPRLIYVSASGYGESSPYRDRPGQDLLMQGLSGLASISGRADQPPTAVASAAPSGVPRRVSAMRRASGRSPAARRSRAIAASAARTAGTSGPSANASR